MKDFHSPPTLTLEVDTEYYLIKQQTPPLSNCSSTDSSLYRPSLTPPTQHSLSPNNINTSPYNDSSPRLNSCSSSSDSPLFQTSPPSSPELQSRNPYLTTLHKDCIYNSDDDSTPQHNNECKNSTQCFGFCSLVALIIILL